MRPVLLEVRVDVQAAFDELSLGDKTQFIINNADICNIGSILNCFSETHIEDWLEYNAESFGYVKK